MSLSREQRSTHEILWISQAHRDIVRPMTKIATDTQRLLSVQSHVVHGYVGNRAATFPLQIRGWDVDVLNTVQFSNHPAYGQFKGHKVDPAVLKEIYAGLDAIGTHYDAVLTGYIPGDDGLEAVNEICTTLCKRGIKWVLDPVLGDHGRLYVSQGNVELYKGILGSGNVYAVTPNQLELEVLSGVKVHDLSSLKVAIVRFNELYAVEHTVVTSVELEDDKDHLYSAGCTKIPGTHDLQLFYFKVPRIHAAFSGSGDLFSAILTSAIFKYNERFSSTLTASTPLQSLPLMHALNEALSVVEKVLLLTYEYEVEEYKNRGESIPDVVKINDLKLIQSREYYQNDMGHFSAVEL